MTTSDRCVVMRESDLCPNCEKDINELLGGTQLPFCPLCRFPLRLIAEKYRLVKKIGEGGFGAVYLARHLDLGVVRVIKLMKQELFEFNAKTPSQGMRAHDDLVARFKREVRLTAALSEMNDHIVQVYDVDEDDELGPYYVMEHLKGMTLQDLLPVEDVLDFALSLHIFEQLCDAMEMAHRRDIIHRDLKPANIFLISKKKEPYFVKIIDFGIAKALDSTTRGQLTHGVIGSPHYMSPEQSTSQPVDSRSDVYALACVLYEMLTGLPPFDDDSPAAILFAHYQKTAESIDKALARVRPDLSFPVGLNEVVMKGLAKAPEDRYQSTRAFWEAVRPFVRERSGVFSMLDQVDSSLIQLSSEDFTETRPSGFAFAQAYGQEVTGEIVSGPIDDDKTTPSEMPQEKRKHSSSVVKSLEKLEEDHSRWFVFAFILCLVLGVTLFIWKELTTPGTIQGDAGNKILVSVSERPHPAPPSENPSPVTSKEKSPEKITSSKVERIVDAGSFIPPERAASERMTSKEQIPEGPFKEQMPTDKKEPVKPLKNQRKIIAIKGLSKAFQVSVLPGTFLMGSPSTEPGRDDDEGPQTKVSLEHHYWMFQKEVTQAQFSHVMGYNPAYFVQCGKNCPVENLHIHQAMAFCNKLSTLQKVETCYTCKGSAENVRCQPKDAFSNKKGNHYTRCKGWRLPTGAEWEYAARAGSKTAVYTGELFLLGRNYAPQLDTIAWYAGNSGVKYKGAINCSRWRERHHKATFCGTHPVSSKKPNAWGFYDMLGNVWEWTWERYPMSYPGGSVTNPVHPAQNNKHRILVRGGSWSTIASRSRLAYRKSLSPTKRRFYVGLRPVRTYFSPTVGIPAESRESASKKTAAVKPKLPLRKDDSTFVQGERAPSKRPSTPTSVLLAPSTSKTAKKTVERTKSSKSNKK